jgi:glycosyltransferase involved in cell wall biosynthesis
MRISFVLPTRSPVPIGGIRVAYEFANRLAARGHQVTVVQPRTVAAPGAALARVKAALWVRRFRREPRALMPWFEVDERVRIMPVSHLDPDSLPAGDVAVATPSWEPAHCVAGAAAAKGRPFFFIQGYDVWFAPEEDVIAAWRLPLRKIVISGWLAEIADGLGEGERTSTVPIGIDLDWFSVEVPPESRPPRVAALLNPAKGLEEILAAAAQARAAVPTLTATYFGTASAPAGLPGWAEYAQLPDRPTLRRLYNSASIFLQASREEGWGLPASEAMACGCALVTYDTGGSREYAIDGETARVVVEPGAASLAAAIAELAGDDGLRLGLSRRGTERVAGYSWDRAVDAFEAALSGIEGG